MDITDQLTQSDMLYEYDGPGWRFWAYPPEFPFGYVGPDVVSPLVRITLTIEDYGGALGFCVFHVGGNTRIFADRGSYWWDAEDVTDPILPLGENIIEFETLGVFAGFTFEQWYQNGWITKVELLDGPVSAGPFWTNFNKQTEIFE